MSVKGKYKNQLEPGQESMANGPVFSHCSLLRNPLPKPTGVLEHYRRGGTKCFSPFWGEFPSDRIPKATNDVNIQGGSNMTGTDFFCNHNCSSL